MVEHLNSHIFRTIYVYFLYVFFFFSQVTLAQLSVDDSYNTIEELNILGKIPIEKTFDVLEVTERGGPTEHRIYHPNHNKHSQTPYVSVSFPLQPITNGMVDVLLHMKEGTPENRGGYGNPNPQKNPWPVRVSFNWVIRALNLKAVRDLNQINNMIRAVGVPPASPDCPFPISSTTGATIKEESLGEIEQPTSRTPSETLESTVQRVSNSPFEFFNIMNNISLGEDIITTRRRIETRIEQVQSAARNTLTDLDSQRDNECYEPLDFLSEEKNRNLFDNPSCNDNYLKEELEQSWRMGVPYQFENTIDPRGAIQVRECITQNTTLEKCISHRLSQNQSFLNAYPLSGTRRGGFRMCSEDPRFGNGSSAAYDVNDTKRLPPHCNSNGLSKLITRELQLVSKCMSVDAEELFPLFNHESGFNFNITARSGSKWGGAGIGQLTGVAVDEVRRLAQNRKINIRRDVDVCKNAYNSVFHNSLVSINSYCDRFSVARDPQNKNNLLLPIGRRNLFYSVALYQSYRAKAELAIADCSELTELPPRLKQKAVTSLTRLSYNIGPHPASWIMNYCGEIIGDSQKPADIAQDDWEESKVDTLFSTRISSLLEKYNRNYIDVVNRSRVSSGEKPIQHANEEGIAFNSSIDSKLEDLESSLSSREGRKISCSN